jgi:hypothetical protein
LARFLLATQTFVDLARSRTSSVRAWLAAAREQRGIGDTDLAISAMSLLSLERHFQDLQAQRKLDAQKLALRARCATLAQEFRHRRSILPFGDDELPVWSQIQSLEPDLDIEGFVLATAIVSRLTLLAHAAPIHTRLQSLGLLLEDPYGP